MKASACSGPGIPCLAQLQSGASVPVREGRKNDDGLLTRGLWQQNLHLEDLASWAQATLGTRPTELFHVITHLADLRVDRVVRGMYLNPLMTATGMYTQAGSLRPQWLQVEDLERIACYDSKAGFDLAFVLKDKCTQGF